MDFESMNKEQTTTQLFTHWQYACWPSVVPDLTASSMCKLSELYTVKLHRFVEDLTSLQSAPSPSCLDQGGWLNELSIRRRSGNVNLMGSNPGQLKPMTYTLYLSLPSQALGIIRRGLGLVGSVSDTST